MQVSASPAQVLIQRLPPLPDEVKKRFPSMAQWETEVEKWRIQANIAIGGKK